MRAPRRTMATITGGNNFIGSGNMRVDGVIPRSELGIRN
jgi:hypothetical protein